MTDETLPPDANQLDLFGNPDRWEMTHAIVDAPDSLAGSRRLPTAFNKANGAIHLYPVRGRYSFVMRRVFNALLALGSTHLRSMGGMTVEHRVAQLVAERKVLQFETSAPMLKQLIGWSADANNAGLYRNLDALAGLQAVWNVFDNKGERWLEKAALISQWGRTADGKVHWLWVPDLFGLLFDPRTMYTPLDLALVNSFASKYTLALWENVYRYHGLGHSGWHSLEQWRQVLVDPSTHRDEREFRRTVLQTALAELKENKFCPVFVEMQEQRKTRVRPAMLRFVLTPRKRSALELALLQPKDIELDRRMLRLGVSSTAAARLRRDYEGGAIEKALVFTERRMLGGVLNNPAGYLAKALKEGYAKEIEAHTAMLRVEPEAAVAPAPEDFTVPWERFRRDEAKRWFEIQDDLQQAELLAAFFAAPGQEVWRVRYRNGGMRNKLFAGAFWPWLCGRPGVLATHEALSLEAFERYLNEPVRGGAT